MKSIPEKIILIGLILVVLYSCENKNPGDYIAEGSLSGSFLCHQIINGQSGDTLRGYCILLNGGKNSGSANYQMNLYVFNFPYSSLNLPIELKNYTYDGTNCGPEFFPDSVISKYKFTIRFKNPAESEMIQFACGPCTAMAASFPWEDFSQVIVEDIVIISSGK